VKLALEGCWFNLPATKSRCLEDSFIAEGRILVRLLWLTCLRAAFVLILPSRVRVLFRDHNL
jgi:hypothetical protein